MLNSIIFDADLYYILSSFFIYSFFGWIMECIVIFIQEKDIVNRGFIRGPFCTIYGAGALSIYFLLSPFKNNVFILFVSGVLLATAIEYITAILMTKLFGDFWWDYDNKPFNYKGILCLESSLAWGFLTVVLFKFLQPFVSYIISLYSPQIGRIFISLIFVVYCIDFSTSFYHANKTYSNNKILREEEIESDIEKNINISM